MTLYAAFGSNMDPHTMVKRAPHSPLRGNGWLEGWRLTFAGEELGWDGALATVVEDPHSRVFVALYDVTPEDENNLDEWEGASLGFYRKVRAGVTVEDNKEHEVAWLYVVDSFEGGLPSLPYIQTMAFAAQKAGAPAEYVESILSTPTQPL